MVKGRNSNAQYKHNMLHADILQPRSQAAQPYGFLSAHSLHKLIHTAHMPEYMYVI